MGMINTYINFMLSQEVIAFKNEEKVQECIDKYWNAMKLPRKLKKKVRKEAKRDYSFWKSLGKYHNSLFNLQ